MPIYILIKVEKKRLVCRIENVKIHLDTVKGLTERFVEVECIDENGSFGEARLREQCEEYLSLLGIAPEQLIAGSYMDLLTQQAEQAGKPSRWRSSDPSICLAPAEKARRAIKKYLKHLEPDELLNLGIEHLDFKWTTLTKLKDVGISYIGELVQRTAEELGDSDFDDKNIAEIRGKLAAINLSLGMSLDYWPPDELLH